jgi:hypothetical protein
MTLYCYFIAAFSCLFVATGLAQAPPSSAESDLHRAARTGDIAFLQSRLQQGADPNLRDALGRTPLFDAVAAGKIEAVRALLAAKTDVNAKSWAGKTPLIEAAALGRADSAKLLIDAGADLNADQRGWGTALETAERSGHKQVAEMLRRAGARTFGRSVGDMVCVRPWGGDGYCGTVLAVDKTKYQIRVTEVVGCKNGCPAKTECSAGRSVGGAGGIRVGDEIDAVSWCLTHTGVSR